MCHFGTTVSTITSSNSARRIPLGATNADGRSLGRDRHHVGPEIATHSATNRSEWREAKRKGPEGGVQRGGAALHGENRQKVRTWCIRTSINRGAQ